MIGVYRLTLVKVGTELSVEAFSDLSSGGS
jgi:hypothetical protein